jgi:hypothetical protein
VCHFRGILRLAAEAGAKGWVGGEGWPQKFDGNTSAEAGIRTDVYVSHAAVTDEIADLIPAREQTNTLGYVISHEFSPRIGATIA